MSAVGTNSFSFTYQWFKNGALLSNATGYTYSVSKSTAGDTGDYTVVIRNNLGFTTSQTVHVGVDETARIVNLATRGNTIVTSTTATPAPKKFLIRGIGPALQQFGVANALLNPTLSVVDSTGKTVATNDDWEQNTNVDDLRAVTTQHAFPLAAGSKDAALLVSLAPGQYTCLVNGVANTSGTALVEIYEVP